jgi:DNA-binding transcriptional MerR regulator
MIDYWARAGYLQPSLTAARGSGTVRRYSLEDVYLARLVRMLSDMGYSLGKAFRLQDLKADIFQGISNGSFLVIVGADYQVVPRDELVESISQTRYITSVIPLDQVRQQVQDKLLNAA